MPPKLCSNSDSMASGVAFEELHGTLVLFSRCAAPERAKVAPSTGFRVGLTRVQPILSGLELANHDEFLAAVRNAASHPIGAGYLTRYGATRFPLVGR